MPLGTNHVTGSGYANGTAQTFIPEIWSDEIIAAYEKNLVLANLVNRMPMTGKKGDTLHIPKPTRGDASRKTAENQVTLIAATESEVVVTIDQHYEYSRLIEDITDVQALASLRQFYTSDAGYALAKQVDSDLFAELLNISNDAGTADGSDYTQSAYQINDSTDALIDYDDTTALGDFTDAAFRNMIQKLDDQDVPMDSRALVIPPKIRNVIMGIDRYNSSDFVGGQPVVNGQIGSLYGVDVFVSTNAPAVDGTTVDGTLMTFMHRDAIVFAEQMGVRTQTQYKQEFLGDLFTADTLYGTHVLRPENAISVVI